MKLVSGESHKLVRKPRRFESSSRNTIEVYHRYIRKINFGDWCNWITREFLALKLLGSSPLSPTILSYCVTVSTTDSDSVCLGSNPSSSTKNQKNIIKIFSKIKFMV